MRGVRIVVLGNGAAGAEKQALALSERILKQLRRARALSGRGVEDAKCSVDDIQFIRVPFLGGALYAKLPPALQLLSARLLSNPFFGYDVSEEKKRLLLGQDDSERRHVVIGCGRTTVSLCAALKQPWATRSPRNVFNIQIQHPRVSLSLFDAVVSPRHDFVSNMKLAPNVYPTLGTVCSIDPEQLRRAGKAWQSELEPYVEGKDTRVVWLIGGPCRGFAFSTSDATEMVDQVLRLVRDNRHRASLLVTFSRRTPAKVRDLIEMRLKNELDTSKELFIWSGEGRNPFEAMLHHGTAVVTTPDSISMTTEAIATGKSVLTVCTNRISGKFKRFHDELINNGYTTALASDATAIALDGNTSQSPNVGKGREAVEMELERISERLASQILSK